MDKIKIQDNKSEILEFIRDNQGKTFRQIAFHLELNEGTLNRAIINLTKTGLIKKDKEKRYFKNEI